MQPLPTPLFPPEAPTVPGTHQMPPRLSQTSVYDTCGSATPASRRRTAIVHRRASPWNLRVAAQQGKAQRARCFRHQLLLPSPYLFLTKPLRLDIQCQRAASVKIGWKYLDD